MPWTLVLAIIFVIAAIVALTVFRRATKENRRIETELADLKNQKDQNHQNDQEERVEFGQHFAGMSSDSSTTISDQLADQNRKCRIAFWCVICFVCLGSVFMIWASAKMIPTKQVGVVTAFGKPSGVLSNGLHFTWPWEKVTQLDGAIQTDNNIGDDATTIRLGNQSTAEVENSIRWRLQPDQADALYRDYRGFGNIRDSLVTRELKAALNQVFKDYDPLSTVKGAAGGGVKQPSISELGNQVTEDLRERIGEDIEVLNVIIPLVRFDAETQGRINAYQAEIANTRIAEQRERTAMKTAAANRALSGSVSNDPNVLVAKCFDALEIMIKEKQAVPAGFSCWPGGVSAVVVPSAQK